MMMIFNDDHDSGICIPTFEIGTKEQQLRMKVATHSLIQRETPNSLLREQTAVFVRVRCVSAIGEGDLEKKNEKSENDVVDDERNNILAFRSFPSKRLHFAFLR